VAADGWEVIARVEGIVVPAAPGAVVRDPRLDPLDLRGRLSSVALTVTDGHGAPVEGARVSWRSAGQGACLKGLAVPSGACTLRAVGPALDLVVFAPGRRSVERRGVSGAVAAVLEPGP